jgi:putative ABC transport system substrate-binding protein
MKRKIQIVAVMSIILALFGLLDAQTRKQAPRIGFVVSAGDDDSSEELNAFKNGLQEHGYIEGKNVLIERKYAMGRLDRIPELVNELVKENVDVIVGVNNVAIQAAKKATKSIPTVFVTSLDPVAAGYVKSFANPGGNLTGLTYLSREISGKRIELLKYLLPRMSRLAVLWDIHGPGPAVAIKQYESAAQDFKISLQSFGVLGPKPNFEGAIRAAKRGGAHALIVVGNPLVAHHQAQIFQLAINENLPTIAEDSRKVTAGALISYGADLTELYRFAATYVDAILKGAKPAKMLVEQPKVFEIFINRRTAKRLGLQIPRRVLVMANEVIE